jgi:hypothetical protein
VTVQVSGAGPARSAVPAPAPPVVASARAGEVSCALGRPPLRPADLPPSFDVNDPRQRALRSLAQQYRPTPLRGPVPDDAVRGAEACVQVLRVTFSLITAGARSTPSASQVDTALTSAGLTNIAVASGPVFGASTGAACLFGTFAAEGPRFTIGPLAADGSCRP